MPDRRGAASPPDQPVPPTAPGFAALLAAGEAARTLSTPPAERDAPPDADRRDGPRGPDGTGGSDGSDGGGPGRDRPRDRPDHEGRAA